jgi:flagellar biosynthesis anti-sigma factor FlgM
MSLRIDNQGQLPVDSTTATTRSSAQSTGTSGATSSSESADTASIGSASTQLSGNAETPIRQDRVDALRTQIDAGTYTPSASAIATAMFQNLFRS